jgi:hypothetical protein
MENHHKNMEKKVTLIEALTAVVTALENDTIDYDWCKTSHCNCGLVAQAVTRTGQDGLNNDYLIDIKNALQTKKKMAKGKSATWTELVAEYCPLTGEPLADVFKKLYEAGMTREDIAHLEYLSDPKILAVSQVNTGEYTQEYTTKETRVTGWWMFKKTIAVSVKKEKKIGYYQVKANLFAYLKAWITILEKEKTQPSELKPAKVIVVNGEEFKYRNTLQLENLKKHFLDRENYEGARLAQEELDKK